MLQHGDVKTLLQKYERFRVSIFVDVSISASFFACLNAQQYWISDQNIWVKDMVKTKRGNYNVQDQKRG